MSSRMVRLFGTTALLSSVFIGAFYPASVSGANEAISDAFVNASLIQKIVKVSEDSSSYRVTTFDPQGSDCDNGACEWRVIEDILYGSDCDNGACEWRVVEDILHGSDCDNGACEWRVIEDILHGSDCDNGACEWRVVEDILHGSDCDNGACEWRNIQISTESENHS